MTLGQSHPTVTAYFDAVNARNFEALATLFVDDVELRYVGAAPRRGREEVVAYYPSLLADFDCSHDEVVRVHVAGDVVVAELRFEGRTVAGDDVAFEAVELFDLDAAGRITRLSLWYDTRDVARQVRATFGR